MTASAMDGPPDLDLGAGVVAWYTRYGTHERAGLIERHPRPDNGQPCEGGVLFDLPGIREAFPSRPVWQVLSADPLTLAPSLLCRVCGRHGFIRDGRWADV
jgi:hypothetical protein